MRPRTVVVRFQPGAKPLTIKVLGRGFHAEHLGAHKAPKKARFLAYWDAWALVWDGVRQSGKALKTRPEQDAKRGVVWRPAGARGAEASANACTCGKQGLGKVLIGFAII